MWVWVGTRRTGSSQSNRTLKPLLRQLPPTNLPSLMIFCALLSSLPSSSLPCCLFPRPQVITSPNGTKNANSRGSSEPTSTQRTDPSAEYLPPSTRTATGSLPSRSRSSYSWGNDGQAAGLQGADRAACAASDAAAQRATQATPQVRAREGGCAATAWPTSCMCMHVAAMQRSTFHFSIQPLPGMLCL